MTLARFASISIVKLKTVSIEFVQVDHEDILCNRKVRVTGESWPSFIKPVESALSSDDPKVYYEEPIA